MGKSLLYKRIRCKNCQKGMKIKRERSIPKYICSSYDNFGTCRRIIIREDYIVDLLIRRFKSEDITQHIQKVKLIEVEDDKELIIHIENDDPIIVSYKDRFYQY